MNSVSNEINLSTVGTESSIWVQCVNQVHCYGIAVDLDSAGQLRLLWHSSRFGQWTVCWDCYGIAVNLIRGLSVQTAMA